MVLPLLVFVGLLLQPSYAQGMCLHLFVLFIFNKIYKSLKESGQDRVREMYKIMDIDYGNTTSESSA
jgi:hypothetical protein